MLKSLVALVLLLSSYYANADALKVTILGSGTPIPSIERFGASTLIEYKNKRYLFDVGRGTTIRLSQIGINPSEVDHVFLTHLHSDHITGFADFWLTGWIWQRKATLNIYGPEGIENFISHTQKAFSTDIELRKKHTGLSGKGLSLKLNTVHQGLIYKDKDVKITAIKVDHDPVENAFGYRFDTEENSILISGDTTFSENLINHGKELDLLIHELAVIKPKLLEHNDRLKKISTYHASLHQAKQVVDLIKPKKTIFNHLLILGVDSTSLSQEIELLFQGNAELAHDLMSYSIY